MLAVEALTAGCYADKYLKKLILFVCLWIVLSIQKIIKLTELLSKFLQVNMHSVFFSPWAGIEGFLVLVKKDEQVISDFLFGGSRVEVVLN